jgi:hypothetical protein
MVQVKALREPLNERAEPKQREHDDCRKSVDRMTYEWHDNGVKHVPTWSKAVRDAMLKGGAEFERQKALNRAAGNWKCSCVPRTQRLVRGRRQENPSSHNMSCRIFTQGVLRSYGGKYPWGI